MGKKLTRKGSCTHCGECCLDCPFLGKVEGLVLGQTKKLSYCKIYPDREKPDYNPYIGPEGTWGAAWNVNFPTHPSQISNCPSCTYEFYDVDTGKKVMATNDDVKGEYDPINEPTLNEHPLSALISFLSK